MQIILASSKQSGLKLFGRFPSRPCVRASKNAKGHMVASKRESRLSIRQIILALASHQTRHPYFIHITSQSPHGSQLCEGIRCKGETINVSGKYCMCALAQRYIGPCDYGGQGTACHRLASTAATRDPTLKPGKREPRGTASLIEGTGTAAGAKAGASPTATAIR